MTPVLVTGVAGFIGFSVARRLLETGRAVAGVDCVDDYYDQTLKEARLGLLSDLAGFTFDRFDLADRDATFALFERVRPRQVIHLAGQAGVRYSLVNPLAYIQSNVVAFGHILEACRRHKASHLTYASSSSVYGANTSLPYAVTQNVDHPLSIYAATKKADELLAHSYSHLFGLPTTGLRFFTVYGPWGRPDMAMYIFTKAILEGRPIDVFNHGRMQRDFTYVDDVVEGVIRVADQPAAPDPAWSGGHPDPATSRAPYRIYNIGNDRPVELMHVIETLERCLGRRAVKNMLPMQAGDVPSTHADVSALARAVGFQPTTPIEVGIERFVAWYRSYHRA